MSPLIAQWRERLEKRLESVLPGEEEEPRELHRAMRYAVQAGGSRWRPLLLLAAAHLGGRAPAALDAACAVELVHSYSLVHDDLPCMDDADFRRGRPSCHRVFGEAVALLAGNALLTLAFPLLTSYPPELAATLVRELASALGSRGLIGGQVADLCWSPGEKSYLFAALAKTGALFRASLRMGAWVGGVPEALGALDECARHLGLAFQLRDDLRDWQEDQGKGRGLNAVKAWGEEGCSLRAREEAGAAERALAPLGERALVLRELLVAALGAGAPGAGELGGI